MTSGRRRQRRRPLVGTLLLGAIAVCLAGVPARAEIILPPVTPATPLDPLADIRDPVFEILLAFNLGWPAGHLSGAELIRRVEASGRDSPIPYRGVIWQRRVPLADSSGASVETVFDRPIDRPVPYEVLGYHPGSFRTTGRFVFRERNLGNLVLQDDRAKATTPLAPVSLGDVHLFVLVEGSLDIDIDGWLDKLAGGNLDDTSIQAMAVFVRDGRRYGLALGRNPDGEGRSGVFDFGTEKVLYPTPDDFKIVSRYLRREMRR